MEGIHHYRGFTWKVTHIRIEDDDGKITAHGWMVDVETPEATYSDMADNRVEIHETMDRIVEGMNDGSY